MFSVSCVSLAISREMYLYRLVNHKSCLRCEIKQTTMDQNNAEYTRGRSFMCRDSLFTASTGFLISVGANPSRRPAPITAPM